MSEKMIKRLESGNIGSALIMTVVLTVLLSMVAVMFVLVARMDSAATGNIADNKMLDLAVKSIIEIIGKELVFDTPGVAEKAGLSKLQYPQYYDYYDYPDVNDAWLASIEPYKSGTDYYWRQISDVTGYLADPNQRFSRQNVDVKPVGLDTTVYVREYPVIKVDSEGRFLKPNGSPATDGVSADADGDGIADSKWIELKQMRTSKGRPIYAAVRVIDNSGMININTAHSFDANSNDETRIDGSTPMQINLAGLLKGTTDKIDDLHRARCDGNNVSWDDYRNKFILQFNDADIHYLPFDISDELELRYRYCVDGKFRSRIETNLSDTVQLSGMKDNGALYDGSSSNWQIGDWQGRITDTNDNGDRRHLLTVLNLDRIIDPDGSRMFNIVADTNAQGLYERLRGCIDVTTLNAQEIADANAYLAQFAANVVDLSDDDANVSVVEYPPIATNKFYGMERPYIYISEITRNFWKRPAPTDMNVYRSYAIELYKEFDDPCEFFDPWQLIISNIANDPCGYRDISIYASDFNDRGGRYYVIIFEDDSEPNANLSDTVKFSDTPDNGAKGVDPNIILYWGRFFLGYDSNGNEVYSNVYDFYIGTNEGNVKDANRVEHPFDVEFHEGYDNSHRWHDPVLSTDTTYYWKVIGWKAVGDVNRSSPVWSFTTWATEPNDVNEYIKYGTFIFDSSTAIYLWRPVGASYIRVDSEANLPNWLTHENDPNGGYGIRSFQRDITRANRLKRLWDSSGTVKGNATLGNSNWYIDSGSAPIQPWYYNFKNVGDAAMVFVKSTYLEGDPKYQIPPGVPTTTEKDVRFDINDPTMQNVFKYITVLRSNDPNETRVKGRININTAPAFIIRQLPWVSRVNRVDLNIAESIVAYRDKLDLSPSGPDYYHAGALNSRWQETGIKDISEANGFGSIGELLNVINTSSKDTYSIRYCGLDGRDQRGFPDLRVDFYSRADFMEDDLEEEELIFARLSDLVTVRSDMFTAYILVRIGTDGPQKRFIAILDRSGVTTADSRVSIKAFQLVPEAR